MEAARLDKWLWAARFFKTRAQAAQAVDGGKVHVNGARAKRGKLLHVGDRVRIRKAAFEHVLEVAAISEVRRGATEAAALYRETPESVTARQKVAEYRRLAAAATPTTAGRPSKRDRREIAKLKRTD